MKEHPLLFSAPMVRAILAGTKSQTRRLITWQGPRGYPHFFDRAYTDNPAGVRRLCVPYHHPDDPDGPGLPCERHYPRWGKGDHLWVKETWACSKDFDSIPVKGILSDSDTIWYRASIGEYPTGMEAAHGKWRPSMFMPRWASRLTLEVTEEPTPHRLQDISEDDARAEGIVEVGDGRWGIAGGEGYRNARAAYRALWAAINGKKAPWEANPWLYRIAFSRVP